MRPVERGAVPQVGGQDKRYVEYVFAKGDLIERLGDYCSYCERHMPGDCAVEHMQPKDGVGAQPHLELEWTNFLLACRNCNSVKGDRPVVLQDYFWPHLDNTFRAFTYSTGGVVDVNRTTLTPTQVQIAQSTMELTGFNRQPSQDPAMRDGRWRLRREVWEIAQDSFSDLQMCDTSEMRRQIVRSALGHGYFSVWMAVFQADVDMRSQFIAVFQGTATSCFDAQTNPIARPGGQI